VSIPAFLAAPLLAVVLAAVLTLATPTLLRWLPVPPDEGELAPFSDLATPGFRAAVFSCSAVSGIIAFACLPSTEWPAWVGLVTLGALLGLIDLRTTFLPLRLNYLALVVAIIGALASAGLQGSWSVLVTAAGAGAGAAGAFWLVWRLSNGLAFGDVRLAGLIGVVVGTRGGTFTFAAFLLGTLIGAVWGVLLRWRRGVDEPFPYGPALLLGPVAALLIARFGLPG